MSALGNPRMANCAYRKVLLTEQEALLAPALTQPKRPSFQRMLLSATMLSAFVWWLWGKQQGPGFWSVTIAIFCAIPFGWAFPPTTLERSRIHVYVTGVRILLLVGISGWYWNWIGALSAGAVILWYEYSFTYGRFSIFRKLAAGQTYSLLPGEPELTQLEAIHLNTLRKGSPYENVSIAATFLMATGLAVWQPAIFAPMTAWMAAGFLAKRSLPIYTEERSRRFRIANWTSMLVAAVLPILYGARIPWIGAVYLAFFFVLFDVKSISLRRKLPVAEWPKRLYW
jgi:hypothetical protein